MEVVLLLFLATFREGFQQASPHFLFFSLSLSFLISFLFNLLTHWWSLGEKSGESRNWKEEKRTQKFFVFQFFLPKCWKCTKTWQLFRCVSVSSRALHSTAVFFFAPSFHIAGAQNVAAVSLYERFGFQSVAPNSSFVAPDKDMYVLLNIQRVLDTVDWDELMNFNKKKSAPALQDEKDQSSKDKK